MNSQEKEHWLDRMTQFWVRSTGRRIDPQEHDWLMGPIGATDLIKDKFINKLALDENLKVYSDEPDFGLLEQIEDLGISGKQKLELRKEVADFYEKTSNYHFDVWSEWRGVFKPFGKILSVLFSKRLQQLNLPLNPIDTSKGLDSKIIKLKDKNTGNTKWTIWYRTVKATKDVIYSGVYTTCQSPSASSPFLKVIFPLPNGNASVVMKKSIQSDGSLLLSSDGKKFGENGFYFTLTDRRGSYWAKYVRSMHEWIHVYVDEEEVLRADHKLDFYGVRFLYLHYRMTKKNIDK